MSVVAAARFWRMADDADGIRRASFHGEKSGGGVK